MASRNARNFEFKLGKQALVLLILGMSFLLFSVFLFGVMVGKHIDAYPEMVSKGIPDMIRKKLSFGKEKKQTEAALRGESDDSGGNEEEEFDLTFYDTLAKKGTGGANATRHVKPGTETGKALSAPSVLVPGVAVADRKAPAGVTGGVPATITGEANPPGGKRPAEDAVDKKDKKTLFPTDSVHGEGSPKAGKRYNIHVASFREKERSDQLEKKLTAQGYPASIITRDVPGKGKWFQVVVNDFKTREEALKALNAMNAKIGGLKATIRVVGEKKD